jgi:hypothetical protein
MSKPIVVTLAALFCVAGPIAPALAKDRDRDGLPDRWERKYHLSTKVKSAKKDRDRDRLRNRQEYKHKTNPRKKDTDRDGLRDRAEIFKYKTNPRKKDTDGDGFSDGAEVKAGTNPRRKRSKPSGGGGNDGEGGGGGTGSPSPGGFPNAASTGVPAGWTPAETRSTSLHVYSAGAVVQDILFTGGASLIVHAQNVTVRRVKFVGTGQINNQPGQEPCGNGLVVEDTEWSLPAGQSYDPSGTPGIQWGGYTARRVKVYGGRSEGLFVSGKAFGCGPTVIEDSLIKLNDNNDCDLHADGIQGYGGNTVIVRNVVADSSQATCGTAPFFYPHSQGNTSATVDRLMVIGGGYSFRLGMPATVRGLKIVNEAWAYGPIDVKCSVVSAWDAAIVEANASYEVTRTVRAQPCNTEAGG